jgi:hypothetical protein
LPPRSFGLYTQHHPHSSPLQLQRPHNSQQQHHSNFNIFVDNASLKMRFGLMMMSLPLLTAGLHQGHVKVHHHARAHGVDRRAIETQIVTVTEFQTVTMTVDEDTSSITSTSAVMTSLTSPDRPSNVTLTSMSFRSPTNPSQLISTVTSQTAESSKVADNTNGANSFATLVPVPNSAMVKNSCVYPVYIWSDGHPSCEGPAAKCKLIEANGTHIERLRTCAEGGISLKVSKDQSAVAPMQFEYTVWPDHVMVSYDISYLNCMKNSNNEKDLSGCAGHDGGIQAVGGGDCEDFACAAGQWCNQKAYVIPEFGYLPDAPVGGCTVDKGIAFELCAGTRV